MYHTLSHNQATYVIIWVTKSLTIVRIKKMDGTQKPLNVRKEKKENDPYFSLAFALSIVTLSFVASQRRRPRSYYFISKSKKSNISYTTRQNGILYMIFILNLTWLTI